MICRAADKGGMGRRLLLVVLLAAAPVPAGDDAAPRPPDPLFTPPPGDPHAPPVVEEIEIPRFPGAEAIWGSTGRDRRGHAYFAVSALGTLLPSAHLFELGPDGVAVTDRGSVLEELKRCGVLRMGESQMKIHTRILEAADGHLYFASMDERGERVDGSRLPLWGSHLWRLKDGTWEHLMTAPEGLIALGVGERYVYALGYWDHVLYQFDTTAGTQKSVRVGSANGYVSRQVVVDARGHAYVPRIRKSDSGLLRADLVEIGADLVERAATPLEDWLDARSRESHGIIASTPMADGSILFTTHRGALYRIEPPADGGAAKATHLGWMHPEGSAYIASLFTYDGKRFVLGAARRSRGYDWVVLDLETGHRTASPLDLGDRREVLLYGTEARDGQGRFLLGGRHIEDGAVHPYLLAVTVK